MMFMSRYGFYILTTLLMISANSFAQSNLTFSSGDKQVATIELFTSHGCSSCPPADKWLRQYTDHPGLWTDVIPMAFHVDYWDYLGWPDEFANDLNTQRQQNYAASRKVASVYTPGVVVKGREWRGFFRRQEPDLSLGDNVGILELNTDLKSAKISFNNQISHSNNQLTAHIALLGFGIESNIGGGENRGRVLTEDFVVLGHHSTKQLSADNQWELLIPSTGSAHSNRLAIVAWVSDQDSPSPLQATGGWLPSES